MLQILPAMCRSRANSSSVKERLPKRRIESDGPLRTSGGITALIREPSSSRASTIGCDSSILRPETPDDSPDDLQQVFFISEDDIGQLDSSTAFDVNRIGTVDQNIGDRIIANQRFDRAMAEYFVDQIAFEPGLVDVGKKACILFFQVLDQCMDVLSQFTDIDFVDSIKIERFD